MKKTRRIEITAVRRRTRITGVISLREPVAEQSTLVRREETVEVSNCELTEDQRDWIVQQIQALIPSEMSDREAESSDSSRPKKRIRRRLRTSLSHLREMFRPRSRPE